MRLPATWIFTKIVSVCLAVSAVMLIHGCSAVDTNKVYITPAAPQTPEEKASKPNPQVSSDNDLFLLAFNELGWARAELDLAKARPARKETQGCLTLNPIGKASLSSVYACSRMGDDADGRIPPRRFDYAGTLLYSTKTSSYVVSTVGAMRTTVYLLAPVREIAHTWTTRTTEFEFPAELSGFAAVAAYQARGTTTFTGFAPSTGDTAESWTATLDGEYVAQANSAPSILAAGSKISLVYNPEVIAPAKSTRPSSVELTSASEIQFVKSGNCLRPVGIFSWTLGVGEGATSGLLEASAQGYTLTTKGASIQWWGPRCLER